MSNSGSASGVQGWIMRQTASNNEAWNHVAKGKRDDGQGNLQDCWTCHYCLKTTTGNVGRVEAHLGDVPNLGITGCTGDVPPDVREKMALAAKQKKENKKRKSLSEQTSRMTAMGILSPATLLGATNAPSEIHPRAVDMGGWGSDNLQGNTGTLIGVARPVNDFGLGNFQQNAVQHGGNIGIAAGLEQPMENTHVSFIRGLSTVYSHPNALQSGRSDVNNTIGGGGSTSSSEMPSHMTASGISSQTTLPGVTSVFSHPNALQSEGSGVNPIGVGGSTSNSDIHSHVTANDMSFQTTHAEAAEMGGQSFANPPQGSTGTLDDMVGQASTSGLGHSQLNAVGDGKAAHLEQPMANTHMSLPSQQPSISQWEGGFGAAGLLDADGDFPFSMDEPIGIISRRSNLSKIPAVPEGAEPWVSNSTRAQDKCHYRLLVDVAEAWRRAGKKFAELEEREFTVKKQSGHLEWINSNVTTGQRKINIWLQQVGQVRERSRGLFKSAENAIQLLQMVEGLTKEVEELIEQSREFDALAMKTVAQFMNCRLDSPYKDLLGETLSMLLV